MTDTLADMTLIRTEAISLLHRVQAGLSPVQLIYTPHDRWPIPHPRLTPLVRRPLQVLVLDSSFNPPTLAHLALANSRRPSYSQTKDPRDPPPEDDYDAKLLLLSVRNADKIMKPGDASYLQRLEMMALLARHVDGAGYTSTSSNGDPVITSKEAANVAIGILDEPTFVGKSRSLLAFLKKRFASFASKNPPSSAYDTQLTFMVGFDTLERLILPQYYASESQMLSSLRNFFSPVPDGDDSRIICARRGLSANSEATSNADSDAKLAVIQEFISSERIVFIDISEDVRAYSSTAVRDARQPYSEAETWRKYVAREIADYIMRERLYTNLE